MITARDHDPPTHRDAAARFRIGVINASVRSDLKEILEDLAVLYGDCCGDFTATDEPIRMEVRASKRSLLGGPRYDILGDGEALFTRRRPDEALPYLEWGINWRIIATRTEYLQLHAATLACAGQAVVLAGPSGAGKSTLAAGLLARGWKYLSDEFALIDPTTLYVHPFPKALCIKAGAFSAMKRLNLPLWRRRHYVKALKGHVGYISPQDLGGRVGAGGYPIRLVVFPRYADGEQPRVYPISRAQAVFSLGGCTLNRDTFRDRMIPILSRVVRRARCLGLVSGPLEETCDLLEALF